MSPQAGTRRRTPLRDHHWKRITAVAAAVAAVLAMLASLTSLIDWFEGRIEPEPAARPETIDTRIQDVRLKSPRQPLGEYLDSTRQSVQGLSKVELREPGLVFTIRVRLRGGTGESFPLLWTLYDMRREARVPGQLYRQEAAEFVPKAETHARAWPIWIPYPPHKGRYRLDLVLTDNEGEPVDERSSREFSIERVPSV